MNTRSYPYRITLMCYSGRHHIHYIKASDRSDAFNKAHRFAIPIAMSGRDGVQFIDVKRLTKAYCLDYGIKFE